MMKKLAVIAALILIISIFIGTYFPIHGEAELYDKVLRLHVLANSDSSEDQALKLKVRDAVIEYLTPQAENCSGLSEMKTVVESSIGEITETAENVIKNEGYDYPVSVTLGFEEYPTRNYESMCFPSGEYLSLRVMIGNAEGQNWWCVLFPPLCLGAAENKTKKENEDAFISAGLTDDQYKIVTETENTKYRARFKILEIIESIFKK